MDWIALDWFFNIIIFVQTYTYIVLQRLRELESATGNECSLYDLGRQLLALSIPDAGFIGTSVETGYLQVCACFALIFESHIA